MLALQTPSPAVVSPLAPESFNGNVLLRLISDASTVTLVMPEEPVKATAYLVVPATITVAGVRVAFGALSVSVMVPENELLWLSVTLNDRSFAPMGAMTGTCTLAL